MKRSETALKPVRILSQSECKRTLSHIKKKKQPVRNVVYNPYEEFRPCISEKQSDDFSQVWERIIKTETISNKIETKKVRKTRKKQGGNPESSIFESVELGINAVSRGVKNKTVCGVLLADDVIPKFLVQHVATLCGIAAIPVLIVPSLRKYTKELLGFSSIAFSLKNIVTKLQNPFHEMYCKIKEFAKVHTAPSYLTQFKVASTKKKPTVKSQLNSKKNKLSLSSDVYLYRGSNSGRAFIPPRTIVKKNPIEENFVKEEMIEEEWELIDDSVLPSKSNTVEDSDLISLSQNNNVEDGDFIPISDNYWVEDDFVSLSKSNDSEETFRKLPLEGISYRFSQCSKDKVEKQSKYSASSMLSQSQTNTKMKHPSYVPFKYIQVQSNPNKKRKFK